MVKLFIVLVLMTIAVEGKKYFGTKVGEYCWSTDQVRSQKWQLSSKTAYQIVKGNPSLYSEVPSKQSMFSFYGDSQINIIKYFYSRLYSAKDLVGFSSWYSSTWL